MEKCPLWIRCLAHTVLLSLFIASNSPIAYGQESTAAQDPLSPLDFEPPVIEHNPSLPPAQPGEMYTFTIVVTDNNAVKEVNLHYRGSTEETYRSVTMKSLGTGLFQASLLPADLVAPLMQYYIQATDTADNAIFRGAPFSPLVFSVGAGEMTPGVASSDMQAAALRGHAPAPAGAGLNWKWILGGLLVVGLAAAGGMGDSDRGPDPPPIPTGRVSIVTPAP